MSVALGRLGELGGAAGGTNTADCRRDSTLPNLLDEGLLSWGVLDVAVIPGWRLEGEPDG